MRIYKMTATFGKLDHAVLELKPGLNVITAPNEWGKSTWCAFLAAMLYGLDTRAKTTKTTLADKERYAPWSGAPMEGSIDLNWNGRDITIQRRTKRRVPLGEFKAYETESGLPVPELTADNCGQLLLGVEQTVFRRTAFIRHSDLPVTQDEALRRRLNALVTTGDDSGAVDRLAESLKDLKNKCRYNRSGLLPQAEAQRSALESKISELETLAVQSEKLKVQLEEIKTMHSRLQNHQQTLAYRKMEDDTARVAQAEKALQQFEKTLQELEAICAGLPSPEEAEAKVRELRSFREQWSAIQAELNMVPQEPVPPQMAPPFAGMTAEAAREMARRDAKDYTAISGSKMPVILWVAGILGILAAAAMLYMQMYPFAAVAGIAGFLAIIWGMREKNSLRKEEKRLLEKYGDLNWKHWIIPILDYERKLEEYQGARKIQQDITGDLEVRLMVLRKKRENLCGSRDSGELLAFWQDTQAKWEACHQARREAEQARSHFETLNAMLRPVEKPSLPDDLTWSEQETARMLTEYAVEQQRLQNRLGQYQGRMELLGDKEALLSQREQINQRIDKLEDTYAALVIAQQTLASARAELQRRFAPRITKRAQELLSAMTDGRYHSLTIREDFSLQAGAGQETTLHDAIWRSDGTVDQLYLALRLAVAEALTPDAPLVLDDALVRFDDTRMQAAMKILKEMAGERQLICFTCQGREADIKT